MSKYIQIWYSCGDQEIPVEVPEGVDAWKYMEELVAMEVFVSQEEYPYGCTVYADVEQGKVELIYLQDNKTCYYLITDEEDYNPFEDDEEETYPVTCTCQHCGKTYEFELTLGEADKYYEYLYLGKYLIQDVFPNRTPSERELLRGGMCGECWNKMFGGLEKYAEDDSEWDEDEFVETN